MPACLKPFAWIRRSSQTVRKWHWFSKVNVLFWWQFKNWLNNLATYSTFFRLRLLNPSYPGGAPNTGFLTAVPKPLWVFEYRSEILWLFLKFYTGLERGKKKRIRVFKFSAVGSLSQTVGYFYFECAYRFTS